MATIVVMSSLCLEIIYCNYVFITFRVVWGKPHSRIALRLVSAILQLSQECETCTQRVSQKTSLTSKRKWVMVPVRHSFEKIMSSMNFLPFDRMEWIDSTSRPICFPTSHELTSQVLVYVKKNAAFRFGGLLLLSCA